MNKALIYLEMAGDQANRVHSLSDARRYYEIALTILDKKQLDRESQQKYIDPSLKWAEVEMMTAMDSVLALRYFYSLYAESLALNGNYHQAEAAHKKAMALSQSGQKWGEIASYRTKAILAARGSISNWRQVDRNMKRSIEMSTREGTATERLLSIFRYADLLHKKGDEDAARNYHRQGRELADRMGCNASAHFTQRRRA